MNCQVAIEKLSEHLDCVLPEAEAAEVEIHLASCAACRAEMEALRRTVAAVKTLPKVRAPRNFAAGVMGAIRAEARPVAEPVKVTPIRSATVFLRLLASVAAICLVWVGVRTMRTAEPVREAREQQPGETAQIDEVKKSLAFKSGDPSKERTADKSPNRSELLDSKAGGSWDATKTDLEKAASRGPAAATGDVAHNAAPKAPLEAGKPAAPADSQAIEVQRLTLYSTDAKGDAKQVQKLLSESGYTWSTQSKAILVRVPASEASRLVAALGSTPGGFRAGGRESLEALERLKKVQDCQKDEEKSKGEAGAKAGLVAEADDLKQLLRDHIDESRRQIQKQEDSKKQKSLEDRAGAPGGGKAGVAEGKSLRGDSKNDYGKTGKADGGVAPGDHEGNGQPSAPGPAIKDAAEGADGTSEAGRPNGGENEKKHDGTTGQAGAGGGVRKTPADDPAIAKGGTDELGTRARKEKEMSDKLSEEVDKQREDQKLGDDEGAVVIYIEFADPPAAEPAASPAKK